jgi:hypothetical protein
MITLFRTFFHELLYSPERARVLFRSFLTWGATMAAQVIAVPTAELATWTLKQWATRLLVAGVAGFALMLKAGEKNPTGGLTPLEPPK